MGTPPHTQDGCEGTVSWCMSGPAQHIICTHSPYLFPLVLSLPSMGQINQEISKQSPFSRTSSPIGVQIPKVPLSVNSGICASYVLRTALTTAPLWTLHPCSSPNSWSLLQLRPLPPATSLLLGLPASCPSLTQSNLYIVTSLVFLN